MAEGLFREAVILHDRSVLLGNNTKGYDSSSAPRIDLGRQKGEIEGRGGVSKHPLPLPAQRPNVCYPSPPPRPPHAPRGAGRDGTDGRTEGPPEQRGQPAPLAAAGASLRPRPTLMRSGETPAGGGQSGPSVPGSADGWSPDSGGPAKVHSARGGPAPASPPPGRPRPRPRPARGPCRPSQAEAPPAPELFQRKPDSQAASGREAPSQPRLAVRGASPRSPPSAGDCMASQPEPPAPPPFRRCAAVLA
ncbi:basic salivary proline-rich protein 2-like [Trichechus manatus latirostris]|uniref:Basic salivary proline-rich protein 2-like n=1 Tax=Trichechus manatus latirostris TaxID=127582 RepID=A0A2Y9FVV8_TRIMA|nr:basic salivary proline-rich protein 2-like [Trichechus manatus latirostris]